jgi:hypothetical protein
MYIKEMLIPTCLPESLLSGYVDSFDLKCIMGCRVSKGGIKSKIDIGPKINIPTRRKLLNFVNLHGGEHK